MSLVFEQIHTPGIAQMSYLLGDSSKGVACIIDPRPDVDCYLDLACKHAISITHIFETHIHADFLSGGLELKRRLPSAKVFSSCEGDARYGFEHEKLKDGDTFEFGDLILRVKHTPGHTAEHLAFVVAEKRGPNTPWGVFSGDSLFADSAGRPDTQTELVVNCTLSTKCYPTDIHISQQQMAELDLLKHPVLFPQNNSELIFARALSPST